MIKKKSKNVIIFFSVISIISIILIASLFFGGKQSSYLSGEYIQSPTFFYYECAPASEAVSSTIINLNTGSSGWISAPDNTDEWDLIVSQTEQTSWYSLNRRIIYQVCHSNGVCDSQVIVNGESFSIFGNTIVPSVRISNLLVGDKVWINYQYQGFGSWYDKENGASWYQTYKPFILWKVDMFGGGRTEYTTIKQGCNFLSSDKDNLLNSITNSIKTITGQSSTSNTKLGFYKTRNFIGTYVPISTANVNFVTYNGKSGYCLNRQIFAITTAVTNGETYRIIDSNFNTVLDSSVECCPGEKETTRLCNKNFQWENIETAECSAFNPCAGADWSPSSINSKQLIRYNCVNSKCVSETKDVECTSNNDCITGKQCDTKTYTCVVVETGEYGEGEENNTILTEKQCIDKAKEYPLLGYEWIDSQTVSCGFLCNIGLSEPKVTENSYCKATFLPYWILGGFLFLLLILIFIVVIIQLSKGNKHKRKKR